MAHQYRAQLPPDIRAGIDANARNKIVFGLNAVDAKEIAPMAPDLTALDFMTLPRYEIYANFMSDGKATGWIRGATLPPIRAIREPAELRAICQATYPPYDGWTRITILQEPVDIVYSIQPVIVQAKNNLIVIAMLKDGFIKSCYISVLY